MFVLIKFNIVMRILKCTNPSNACKLGGHERGVGHVGWFCVPEQNFDVDLHAYAYACVYICICVYVYVYVYANEYIYVYANEYICVFLIDMAIR